MVVVLKVFLMKHLNSKDKGNDGRMTYHFSINIPGYKQNTVKAQLRNGLLKLYFEVLEGNTEENQTVNIQ